MQVEADARVSWGMGVIPGGTKRATSANMPLVRLQSSEGKFATSREIEPVRRSFCRHRSRTSTEVARLVPSGDTNIGGGGLLDLLMGL